MKIQESVWICIMVMVMLFLPLRILHAGECDEVYAKAKNIHTSANKAVEQKNFEKAVQLYREAARYYDQASTMQDCDCPKIHKASRGNSEICENMILKCENWKQEYTFLEDYNRATARFNEGNAYARNREWDEAISAFEEAAQVWEDIASSAQDENGQQASRSAKQARDAADSARRYQRKQ